MRSATWWLAMILTLGNAITFVIAMVAFFRSRHGAVALRLTLFVSIAIGLVAVVGSLAARTNIDAWAFAVGSMLAVAAQAVFWSAVRSHGDHRPSGAFATDPPATLARGGAYRWVRHPFYVAYVLAFAAGAVFVQQLWVWVVPIWMQALYAFAARQEERLILSSSLAAAYDDYRRRVGAFVPRASRPWLRSHLIYLMDFFS